MKFLVWNSGEVAEKEAASADDLNLQYAFHFVPGDHDVEELKKLVKPGYAIGLFEKTNGKGALCGYCTYRDRS